MGPTPETTAGAIFVDASFPGGNVILEQIRGDDVYVRQDLRDTEGDWFYWYFRVGGSAGRTLTFHFTHGDVIGVHGPAVSTDGGCTWSWLGGGTVAGHSFRYTFPKDIDEVRFSVGVPYLEANLRQLIDRHGDHPCFHLDTLCHSEAQRPVERIRLLHPNHQPPHRVLLTCRHHCCEAMASYVLEGIIEAFLDANLDGPWLQHEVEFLIIPFVDKDGVEQGDQGKRRRPRDHNRDYSGESIYRAVRAIRDHVPSWSEGQLKIAIDLHCPGLKGRGHECIYMVGSENQAIWHQQQRFAQIMQEAQTGPLVYRMDDNLPYGRGWNTATNWREGTSFSRWAGTLPGIRLSTSIEVPYANVKDTVVLPEKARLFGHDVARAIRNYLQEEMS
jgi:hypothetical protein